MVLKNETKFHKIRTKNTGLIDRTQIGAFSLTYLSRLEFPTVFNWTSPFPF